MRVGCETGIVWPWRSNGRVLVVVIGWGVSCGLVFVPGSGMIVLDMGQRFGILQQ